MDFSLPDDPRGFLKLWGAVRVVRKTPFHLFTFGETALPYKLALEPKIRGDAVGVVEGEITVARPTIITPGNAGPEFRGFFSDLSSDEQGDDGPSFDPGHGYDDGYPNSPGGGSPGGNPWAGAMGEGEDGEEVVRFLMSRGVKFGNLKIGHRRLKRGVVARSPERVVEQLQEEILDEDDRTGILLAPHGLGGVALVRYAAECIMESAPGNIGELRERGFLP
ncbi:hypothetical protein [Alienimonas californiensis]|uniref:Uncharacterized protein n=1 Tax=Alienimonas californiensis TaxID=2527989 RepID=A0A517P7D7_9PLAN|nr:hypothetical protein [Alienimonas californiensis]QDT15287.1 hypothetical protein CA12_13700 [Alienimonas californiensis]